MKNTSKIFNTLFVGGLVFLVIFIAAVSNAVTQKTPNKIPSTAEDPVAAAQRKCDAGETSACFDLGKKYRDGKVVAKDITKAVNLLAKACDGNLADACAYLGWLYKYGDEVGTDEVRAAGFYARAVALWDAGCERQDLEQCVSLGDHYNYGGDKSEKPKAAAAYGKACAAGMLAACTNQGRVLEQMHTDESEKLAVNSYRKACDGGETEACGDLGAMYQSGWGVPQDVALAARLFIKGCDAGSGIWYVWCNKAGVLYSRGEGVAQNGRTAFDLFKKGCETKKPYAAACVNLAGYYEDGEVVPKDLEKARKLYAIGCADEYSILKEQACKKLKELRP